MNRFGTSSLVSLAVMAIAGSVGCGASSTPANNASGAGQGVSVGNATAEEDFSPGADDVRAFHRHHHEGFIGFALVSIPSLGVTPAEEAAVEKIRADMQSKMQPARDAEASLLNIVADGIAAGAIDKAKVDAAIAKINDVAAQMDDATNDALNQLHATLTAPERQALALKVQAHYEIWEKANANQAAQPDQEKQGGHIHHLAQVLALTPDQVDKIDAAFTASMTKVFAEQKFDSKAAEDHLQAFVKGFTGASFDAKTLATADKANTGVTSWGAMRMVRMYEAMTPVLSADQRTKLAGWLREHANKTEVK